MKEAVQNFAQATMLTSATNGESPKCRKNAFPHDYEVTFRLLELSYNFRRFATTTIKRLNSVLDIEVHASSCNVGFNKLLYLNLGATANSHSVESPQRRK